MPGYGRQYRGATPRATEGQQISAEPPVTVPKAAKPPVKKGKPAPRKKVPPSEGVTVSEKSKKGLAKTKKRKKQAPKVTKATPLINCAKCKLPEPQMHWRKGEAQGLPLT